MEEFVEIYLGVFGILLLVNIFWRLILWGKIFGHNVLEMLFPVGNIDLLEYNIMALFPAQIHQDIIADHFERSRKLFNILVIFYYRALWLPFIIVLGILAMQQKW